MNGGLTMNGLGDIQIGGIVGSLLAELGNGIEIGGLFGDFFAKIRPFLSMIFHDLLGL